MKQRALIGWGIGSFTSSALVGAVGLLHLRFMTDSLGLAMGLAGMLVVIAKIYDAALDPVMGVISDRTRTRWGRHRPYLFAGGLCCATSLVLLFNVPQGLSGTGLVVFVAFSLLLFSTAYTMFRIPYLALGRSITQDFDERSKLMTFSVYGASLGGLAATSAAPYLLATLGSDRAGHGAVAWILAALIATGGVVSFLLIDTEAGDSGTGTKRPHVSFREAWAALRENRPFQHLIGFKVTMFAGLTLNGAAIPYYTRHVLAASDVSLSGIFLAQMIAMMASQVLWVRVAHHFGRRDALMAASLLQMIAMLCWYVVPPAHPSPWVQILGAFQGVCAGGIFFGLYTVLTDTMDLSRKTADGESHAGREGILAGVFVMVEKATAAFGTFVFSAILGSVGYVSAKNAGAAAQPHEVIVGIGIAMSVIPAAFALVACLFLRRLDLPHVRRARAEPGGIGKPVTAVAALLLVGLAMSADPVRAETPVAVPTMVMIKRVYTGEGGRSTMDEVELPRVSGGDGRSVGTRLYATDVEMGLSAPGSFIDWHGVTTPRLLVVIAGALEIGLGDGTTHVLTPGTIVLVMDMTGKGHTSRSIGRVPVQVATIRLPSDDPLKPKLNSCPPNVAPDKCVANGVAVTRAVR
ncbi:MFS transporter [Sphingomonas sp. 4RDLI-65]|uniref:MFS transporter n=1 Tax=Sphingomonas sp. 4RDLI-65 TaxID=3111641 RepID=UPI003C212D3D